MSMMCSLAKGPANLLTDLSLSPGAQQPNTMIIEVAVVVPRLYHADRETRIGHPVKCEGWRSLDNNGRSFFHQGDRCQTIVGKAAGLKLERRDRMHLAPRLVQAGAAFAPCVSGAAPVTLIPRTSNDDRPCPPRRASRCWRRRGRYCAQAKEQA